MSENYQYMKKYTEKYLAKMDEIRIRMPKESGLKESIKAHAESKGESVQAFILRAIQETMRNDKRKGDCARRRRRTMDGKLFKGRIIEQ